MKTTIILADDHPLILNGTKGVLEKLGYHVIDTATDGQTAYNKILKLKPHVAILDFDMPKLSGIEIAKNIKKNNVPTKTIILTLHKQESILSEVGKAIEGYITKDTALEELEVCIKHIISGDTYTSSKLQNSLHFDAKTNKDFKLSASEIKILKYLDQDFTSAQIAEELFISKRTVEKHRSNIIKKLELDSSSPMALILWLKNNPDLF
ncbi:response regulator transcription factor [Tamlana haliotis]|uniref:Response regulator transcription factor n=1 Tax=Pseudotamlana haliotis TaxID=2614804 RepID=A0A6N6MM84_9FLAO|nr:response regulator transcription factor [Tamlana haliotis]KAB1069413.1 response regulator transcription factor [Tamlana haliotis]